MVSWSVFTPCVFLSTPSARRATTQPHSRGRCTAYFYPRPPRGGRHVDKFIASFGTVISIHALREEGDVQRQYVHQELRDFYPRPPRGGRLSSMARILRMLLFLSTPSARRATIRHRFVLTHSKISIHALREEGDSKNRDKISIFL